MVPLAGKGTAAFGAVLRWRKIGIPTGLALVTTLGAEIGVVGLAGASGSVLATVLAFGAVAFTYLVTKELLVRAHEQGYGSVHRQFRMQSVAPRGNAPSAFSQLQHTADHAPRRRCDCRDTVHWRRDCYDEELGEARRGSGSQ
ncbi:MAG: hypothetical protein JWO59_3358 [Chloroflexi bacterium]|nr:hypothetical protein [Chloroflexota bacterium]